MTQPFQSQPQPRQLPRQRPHFFNGTCNCCRGGDACACADDVQMLLTISGAAPGLVPECTDFNADYVFDRSFFPEACYWLANFSGVVLGFGLQGFIQYYPDDGHWECELQTGGANNLHKYKSTKDLFFCNLDTPVALSRYFQSPVVQCEWGTSITITPFVLP